jgi:indole-3-acetate monooxygenase
VVTLCAGAGLFAGYLDPVFAGEVFTSPKVCLAGSGQVGGTAVPEHEGFRISGTWPHASGGAHATHLTANCRIEGSGAVRSFLFLREEVSLFSNWETIGLKATGSHGYSVNGLWVPAHRCFEIEAKAARWKEPVYHFPFLPFAEATLAVNLSGMSLHFLEEAEALIHAKQPYDEHSTGAQAAALALLSDLREEVQALRHHFYRALDGAWQAHVVGLPSRDLEALSKWSRALAQGARSAVDTLYPFCGLEAARPDTTINRIWRDLHTASQHALLR